jgi:hypothetical protein
LSPGLSVITRVRIPHLPREFGAVGKRHLIFEKDHGELSMLENVGGFGAFCDGQGFHADPCTISARFSIVALPSDGRASQARSMAPPRSWRSLVNSLPGKNLGSLEHEVDAATNIELNEQRGDVKLDGSFRQVQLCGNLFVGEILNDACKHFFLAAAQGMHKAPFLRRAERLCEANCRFGNRLGQRQPARVARSQYMVARHGLYSTGASGGNEGVTDKGGCSAREAS